MKVRIIVSAVGIPLLLLVLLVLPPIATALLVGAMTMIAAYELLWRTGLVRNVLLVAVSALMALTVSLWCSSDMRWQAALIGLWGFLMVLVCLMIASHGKIPFEQVGLSVFAGLIVPMMLSALTRIGTMDYGKYYILIPLVLCFGTDSAAYFVGCAIGRHKLAPIISPKKSWEGAIGGALGGIVLMFLYTLVLDIVFGFEVRYGACILYGIFGAIVCVIGDLAFSVVKRQSGIKDYGELLPGHGGILDRFDSMTFVAPMAEALLLVMPLIVA